MTFEVVENVDKREYFGGGDGRAINRHSVREFSCDGKVFQLDRNLSGYPPFYQITLQKPGICPTIKVDGEEYFGGGLSWPKATEIAVNAIQQYCKS